MAKAFFKEIEVDVPEGIYEPREDTMLVANLLEYERPASALEIGCGSGLLSIVLAKNGSNVTAADIDPRAVRAAEMNAEKNNVKLRVVQSDLFENVAGKFGLIVFNAPYLKEEQGEESLAWAGGKSLEVIRRFVAGAREHLDGNGKILMVISSLTGKEEVEGMLKKAGFTTRTAAEKKIPWETLFVIEAR